MFAGMLLLAGLFVWLCIVPTKPLEPTLPEIGPGAPQHHAAAKTDLQPD